MPSPDKVKVIHGDDSDISVSVAQDGVCLGFFAKNGSSVVVSLDKIRATLPNNSEATRALTAWVSDRIDQAKHIAG